MEDFTTTLKVPLSSAIKFWEIQRLTYNAALVGTTVAAASANNVNLLTDFDLSEHVYLLVLAVVANLLYWTAYIPDVILSFSNYVNYLKVVRVYLLVFGVLLACLVAYAMMNFQLATEWPK